MKMPSPILVFIIQLFLIGCASSPKVSTNSVINPDSKNRKISSIFVVADGGVLSIQKELEISTIKSLREHFPNLKLASAHENIFPPLSMEKVNAAARKSGAEAILILAITGSDRSKGPDTTYGTVYKTSPNTYGYQASTYSSSYVGVSIEARLIDVIGGGQIWLNQSALTASTAAEIEAMYPTLAKTISTELVKENILTNTSAAELGNEYDDIVKADVKGKRDSIVDGFRTMKWNDAPGPKMEQIGTKPGMIGYSMDGEPLEVFGQRADYIAYFFRSNKFSRLEISWGFKNGKLSGEEYSKLKKQLIELFGKPDSVDILDAHRWSNTQSKTSILLSTVNAMTAKKEGYVVSLIVDRERKF